MRYCTAFLQDITASKNSQRAIAVQYLVVREVEDFKPGKGRVLLGDRASKPVIPQPQLHELVKTPEFRRQRAA